MEPHLLRKDESYEKFYHFRRNLAKYYRFDSKAAKYTLILFGLIPAALGYYSIKYDGKFDIIASRRTEPVYDNSEYVPRKRG